MVDGIARARIDLAAAVAGLLIGLAIAPVSAMILPALLVLAGTVLSWRRPNSRVGVWLLRAGGALALVTAITAYGMDGHVTSHTRKL